MILIAFVIFCCSRHNLAASKRTFIKKKAMADPLYGGGNCVCEGAAIVDMLWKATQGTKIRGTEKRETSASETGF